MTPEQEQQVRRALAAAAGRDQDGPPSRPDAPMPAEVAARLDQVLADLTASRRTADGGSSVTRLSGARDDRRARRRPTAGKLLVAAAAVSVIALAGGAVVSNGLGGSRPDAAGSSTAEAGDSAGGSGGRSRVESGARDNGGTDSGDPPPAAVDPGALPRVRSDALRRDVQRLVGGLPARGGPAPWCATPPVAAGSRLLAVRLDGEVATLVLDRAEDGRRVARVYSCATARPLGRTTVDAR